MKISDALIALKKTQLQMRGKNLVFKPRLLNTKNAAQPKNEPHLLIKAEYNLDGAKILQKASVSVKKCACIDNGDSMFLFCLVRGSTRTFM